MNRHVSEKTAYFGIVAVIYAALLAVSIGWPYFWDNIQQVGREGSWIYDNSLGSLVTRDADHVVGTGYHVPGVAYVTAAAWTLVGRSLWVSHVLTAFWAAGLTWAVWRLAVRLVPPGWRCLVGLAVMVEPAVLSLMATASPDFWMLAAFALALAALADEKYVCAGLWMLSMGLCNMRGVMAAVCLGLAACLFLWMRKSLSWRKIVALAAPSTVVLGAYYVFYLVEYGWFMSDSPYAGHYDLPSSGGFILRHVASLGLRMAEGGRAAVWGLALCVVLCGLWRARAVRLLRHQAFSLPLLFAALQFGLFLLFCFISQMPFGGRYFAMTHLALTFCVLSVAVTAASRRVAALCLALVFAAELTGHAWVAFYPERLSKSWDTSLAHAPYYGLRREAEEAIDQMGIPRSDIATGFCLNCPAEMAYLDDSHSGFTGGDDAPYYLLSNLCNEEDSTLDAIADQGVPIKTWRSGLIYMTLYKINP